MMCKQDFFFPSSTLFSSCCKALSVISAARLAALIASFIRQLGRVILWCDKLCIMLVCYLKNNLCINPHQPIKPLSISWNIQAIMLISCEKPCIYWLVAWKGENIFFFLEKTVLVFHSLHMPNPRQGGDGACFPGRHFLTSWSLKTQTLRHPPTFTFSSLST